MMIIQHCLPVISMRSTTGLFIIFLITAIIGCSARSADPIQSGASEIQFLNSFSPEEFSPLGIFSLDLNKDTLSAELTPIRTTSLTDTLEAVDMTNFLTLSPCTDCARIKSVGLDSNENLVVTIGIKHPFDAGNIMEPVSGKNRADLHVFNVEGIVI